MKLSQHEWKFDHFRDHLQAAVNLEFWTIPFYMSAMYSIQDKSEKSYQLMRTVLNQEMLHLQSAANIANAYGLSPTLAAPQYVGTKIPYLDFTLDPPEAVKPYLPYTAEIGPLDKEHINAMCLIEIPIYETQKSIELRSNVEEYGSIGAFYEALRFGAERHKADIRGGVKQVDFFSALYRNMPNMTITNSGADGFNQVELLINLITDQGEGVSKKDETIPPVYQNTADDTEPDKDHFEKFNEVKNLKLPKTFKADKASDYTKQQKQIEAILLKNFTDLRAALEALFSGENPENFFVVMSSVGGSLRNCWQHKVTPKFS